MRLRRKKKIEPVEPDVCWHKWELHRWVSMATNDAVFVGLPSTFVQPPDLSAGVPVEHVFQCVNCRIKGPTVLGPIGEVLMELGRKPDPVWR